MTDIISILNLINKKLDLCIKILELLKKRDDDFDELYKVAQKLKMEIKK